ncbi:MAG: sodium/solute symporter [Bacteroidales bacterium]|jgi:SSS family solute:Na+ symporter|nr:sodium/solute symporter [Bacteroidales bacterium]MCI2121672.1 sodium/solute symporter [Bacteroidales bacterium]MCI2144637.1 sodium/solute symporter [Bacteroidales bacterium]
MNVLSTLSVYDLIVIAVYFVFIVIAGLHYRNSKDSEHYFLAGRNMSWPVIGFSMFAASISSSTLIGNAGDAYSTGIAVFNYNLMSIFVIIFVVWFILPLYLKSNIYTLPQFLELRFDERSRYYFSIITILVNIFLDGAGALYAASLVMHIVFPHASLLLLAAIFAVIVAIYTIPGGLSAAIRIDLIQGIFLTLGSIVLTIILISKGGADYVADQWNNGLMMHLVRPLDDLSVPWLGMIVGIPVLGFFFWGNNQQLMQRVLTAKSVDEGRKGVLLTGFLTLLTLFIIIIPGVMAHKFFPSLKNPDMVYPSLVIKMMPVGLVGFMLAALIAALTSSLSGLLNSVATLVTMDFYVKIKKDATSKDTIRVARITSIIVLIIAVVWAPMIGTKFSSLLKYYQEMLTMLAPPVVAVFLLGIFWKRATNDGAFWGLIGGAVLGVINLYSKLKFGVSIFGHIHFLLTVPFYLIWSMLIMIVVSLLTKKPDYTRISPYLWSKADFHKETLELRKVKAYDNYRYLSYGLIVLCLITLVVFA